MNKDLTMTVTAALTAAALCLPCAESLATGPGLSNSMQMRAADLTSHARLADLDEATPLRVRNLRLDTGRLIDLDLRRFDIFTDDATLLIGSANGDRPMPKPDVVLLRGAVRNDAGSRAFVSVSRFGTHGYVETEGELHFISTGAYDAEAVNRFRMHVTDARMMPEPPPAESFCGVEHDKAGELNPFGIAPVPHGGGAAGPGDGEPPCRVARIAWETDWEFTGDLFGGNTQASADYATTLAGAVSEIYFRDLRLRHTISFLRIWEDANDPWTEPAIGDQMIEFRDHWRANMGHIGRELAHMLSGRVIGGGLGYVGVMCSTQWGYAISADLRGSFPYPLRNNHQWNWDPYVTAHEAGHNHGTLHTHDYDPPIDGCGIGDCSNPDGTIMSYCHGCPGGLGNIRLELHPRVQDHILAYLDGVCDLTDPNNCATFTLPTGISVAFGTLQSGDVEDLHDSDDEYVTIGQRAAVAPTLPVVRLDVFGTSSLQSASELTYTLEAAATALPPTVPQTIQLHDYDANSFDTVDSRTATTSDSVVNVLVTDDPSRFIEAGTDSVWARLNWFDPGDVLFAAWGVRIDQAVWAFAP